MNAQYHAIDPGIEEPPTSVMSSTTISHRVLGCLVLAVLSQYADANKSHYLESILVSLQRLEDILTKQAEQNTWSCIVPVEKLFSLLPEHQMSSESHEVLHETKSAGTNPTNQKALDVHIQQPSAPRKHRKNNRSYNENINANINENVNANINANRYHRRSVHGNSHPHLSNAHNPNMNSNFNFNSNKDIFDFSDEDEEI